MVERMSRREFCKRFCFGTAVFLVPAGLSSCGGRSEPGENTRHEYEIVPTERLRETEINAVFHIQLSNRTAITTPPAPIRYNQGPAILETEETNLIWDDDKREYVPTSLSAMTTKSGTQVNHRQIFDHLSSRLVSASRGFVTNLGMPDYVFNYGMAPYFVKGDIKTWLYNTLLESVDRDRMGVSGYLNHFGEYYFHPKVSETILGTDVLSVPANLSTTEETVSEGIRANYSIEPMQVNGSEGTQLRVTFRKNDKGSNLGFAEIYYPISLNKLLEGSFGGEIEGVEILDDELQIGRCQLCTTELTGNDLSIVQGLIARAVSFCAGLNELSAEVVERVTHQQQTRVTRANVTITSETSSRQLTESRMQTSGVFGNVAESSVVDAVEGSETTTIEPEGSDEIVTTSRPVTWCDIDLFVRKK